MNNIMYLCEGEHSQLERILFISCRNMKRNHLKNWLEKSDLKFNLELPKFLNWTFELEPDMANYELLIPNFSLNSIMDRQLNYNYNFLNFQNYQL